MREKEDILIPASYIIMMMMRDGGGGEEEWEKSNGKQNNKKRGLYIYCIEWFQLNDFRKDKTV